MTQFRVITFTLIFLLIASSTFACTIFTASKNGITLAGNNEDMIDPETNIWFIPSTNGSFGRVYFGFDVGFPQGGMNDKGLFFDCAATKPHMFEHIEEREEYEGNVFEKMLEECATVDEVLDMLSRYDLTHMFRFQVLIADKTGDAAIIEGETVLRKDSDYMVVTNFRQSLNEENPYSLDRFTTADSILDLSNAVTTDLFRSILEATSQKEGSVTQYSTIFNLNSGDITIYHFHDFSESVTINIHDELAKNVHSLEIPSMFAGTNDAFAELRSNTVFEDRIGTTVDPSVFKGLTGIYQVMPQLRFIIREDSGKLYGRMSGFSRYELIPENKNTYFFRELKAKFLFNLNDDGVAESLIFDMYGSKMSAKKIR
jgi:Acyl-coenzyme A:6-aminopenicillanic acid acyl-transferase